MSPVHVRHMNRSNRTLASLDYTARGTGVAPWQIEGGRKRKKKKKTRGGKTGRELWWRHNSVSEPSERVSYVFQKHSAPSPYVHNTLKLPSLLSFSPFLPNVSRCFLFAGSRISSSCLSLAPSRRCPLSPRTYGRAFTPFFSVHDVILFAERSDDSSHLWKWKSE